MRDALTDPDNWAIFIICASPGLAIGAALFGYGWWINRTTGGHDR